MSRSDCWKRRQMKSRQPRRQSVWGEIAKRHLQMGSNPREAYGSFWKGMILVKKTSKRYWTQIRLQTCSLKPLFCLRILLDSVRVIVFHCGHSGHSKPDPFLPLFALAAWSSTREPTQGKSSTRPRGCLLHLGGLTGRLATQYLFY